MIICTISYSMSYESRIMIFKTLLSDGPFIICSIGVGIHKVLAWFFFSPQTFAEKLCFTAMLENMGFSLRISRIRCCAFFSSTSLHQKSIRRQRRTTRPVADAVEIYHYPPSTKWNCTSCARTNKGGTWRGTNEYSMQTWRFERILFAKTLKGFVDSGN